MTNQPTPELDPSKPIKTERQYPIRPRPVEDPRFTFGFALDVAKVLKDHGYPEITSGRDFMELQQALFGFLYVGPDA